MFVLQNLVFSVLNDWSHIKTRFIIILLFSRVNSLLWLGENVYDVSLAPYNDQIFFIPHSDVVTSTFTSALQNGQIWHSVENGI
jgi:hypothetical protein